MKPFIGVATMLLVLGSAAMAAPPSARSKDDVLAWAAANLHLTGWTYLNHSPTVVRFVSRPYPGEREGRVRVKMRAERLDGPGSDGERSLLTEVEMDCARHRSKILMTQYFGQSDLRALISQRKEPDSWRAADGPMADAFARACGSDTI